MSFSQHISFQKFGQNIVAAKMGKKVKEDKKGPPDDVVSTTLFLVCDILVHIRSLSHISMHAFRVTAC